MNDNGLMDQPTAFRLALRASKMHHHRYRVWGYRSGTGHWRYLISRLPDVPR